MPRRKTRRKRKQVKQKVKENTQANQELQQRIKELETQLAKLQQQQLQQQQIQQQLPAQQLQEVLSSMMNALNSLKEAVEGNPDKLLRDAKGLVMAIANDPSTARASGFHSGINTAVVKNEIERAMNGEISFNELINLIDNGWNWVKGFFVGDTAFQESVREVEKAKRKAAGKIADRLEEEYR
ncbi:MAG: hypothetical protein ACXQS2_00325 [Methermicoccaceae archaeon]